MMTRKLGLAGAALTIATLSGCAMQSGDEGQDPQSIEQVGSSTEALKGAEFDSRDSLLSALGSATIDCLGTVDPHSYVIKGGTLVRTFQGCVKGASHTALTDIDAILGVANSAQGKKDQLAAYYVATWKKYLDGFPSGIEVCPTWKRSAVLNPPTFENVKAAIDSGEIGKEGYLYTVTDLKQCKGNPSCEVKNALACAGGFGSQFLVSGDPKKGTVTVDPAWWLTHYEYVSDESNPFMMPGYYHAMSYYGTLPGSVYGAVERAGERCSQYSAGKHYTDRKLVPIDCGGGWKCMSYCM